ncbi:MAG TPA: hypothetical protein PK286_10455 [Devosia sp.]|nr:hypothetical protein [Devosia sp.]
MPYTIDISSERPDTRVSLFVPAQQDRGLVWMLIATIRAHFAIRRVVRRLQQTEQAASHLSAYLRADIGLPPQHRTLAAPWEPFR